MSIQLPGFGFLSHCDPQLFKTAPQQVLNGCMPSAILLFKAHYSEPLATLTFINKHSCLIGEIG